METPTIGRIVHYYASSARECRGRASRGQSFVPEREHAAIVRHVKESGTLGLNVFDRAGKCIIIDDVPFIDPLASTPAENDSLDVGWCCWPQDSLERQVRAKQAGA